MTNLVMESVAGTKNYNKLKDNPKANHYN